MVASVWKDSMIIQVYELAKSGMMEVPMAKVLGISTPTFRLWETKRKLFRMAVKMGRKEYRGRGKQAMDFQQYIYNRLSSEMKQAWNRINRLAKEKKGIKKVEAFLEKKGTTVRQHLFLYSYTVSNFNISKALRKVNISRATFDYWREKDKNFAAIVKEIDWHKKNFFENYLVKLVVGGDVPSTLFVNKTFNADRYADPKKQIDVNLGQQYTNAMSISDLKLPIEVRKTLLKAIRKRKKELEAATNVEP